MDVKIVKSVKDDYGESSGPSTTTHAFLSIDGMLFELGRFYIGPYMVDGTERRLAKLLEFEKYIAHARHVIRQMPLSVKGE